VTTDYREVLANDQIDAVYVAVPHNLHEKIYCDSLAAGKHLMGEKPFGIDLPANRRINNAIAAAEAKRSDLLIRAATQYVFIPGFQRIGREIAEGRAGRILEVEVGFLHSSDLNPQKPVNWKRRLATNGSYGVMGDLGMHVCHFPFRAGWLPSDVRAILSDVVSERPDGTGGMAPCETWDNATLLCRAHSATGDEEFPLTLKTQRIAPGESNTLYIRILGTRCSYRFSTKRTNLLEVLRYEGAEQEWRTIDIGHAVTYPSITGGIFEFGFSDAILQMWAAFMSELDGRSPANPFATCATADEMALSHRLFTAALKSHESNTTVPL
jgi:predicted dehydrogenase